jgi:hypothetical protein
MIDVIDALHCTSHDTAVRDRSFDEFDRRMIRRPMQIEDANMVAAITQRRHHMLADEAAASRYQRTAFAEPDGRAVDPSGFASLALRCCVL